MSEKHVEGCECVLCRKRTSVEPVDGPYEVMWSDDAAEIESLCNFVDMAGGDVVSVFYVEYGGFGVLAKWKHV